MFWQCPDTLPGVKEGGSWAWWVWAAAVGAVLLGVNSWLLLAADTDNPLRWISAIGFTTAVIGFGVAFWGNAHQAQKPPRRRQRRGDR